MTGIKHDSGKPPVGLLFESFPRALKEVARVAGYGEKEYGRGNWAHVENGQIRYKDAMGRHILDRAIDGDISPETGLYHLAQVVWNGLAELELFMRNNNKKLMSDHPQCFGFFKNYETKCHECNDSVSCAKNK